MISTQQIKMLSSRREVAGAPYHLKILLRQAGARFTKKILGKILSLSHVHLKFILSYKVKIFIDFYM